MLASDPVFAAPPLPRPVAAFIAKRERCDHWRGEEPYDAARTAEIAAAVRRSCKGTDAELEKLRHRYHHDRRVLARLRRFETRIE